VVLETILLILVFLAAYFGFVFLALSQLRNWKRVTSAQAHPRRELCSFGCFSLAMSAALCFVREEVSFGALLWIIIVSIAALAVTFTLAYRPTRLRSLTAILRF
jgi:hypothetical protein